MFGNAILSMFTNFKRKKWPGHIIVKSIKNISASSSTHTRRVRFLPAQPEARPPLFSASAAH